ncbi:hypothetical protein [Shuttleworthella sp. MSX8B]|uniref:hypothetical protein n=1 Tax=Shuttleworthella sp. MSX8B TaxID=936574 RepID=UPI001FA70456|nr:hypothetical protein [Shuttleworthia sp. MSX8B]
MANSQVAFITIPSSGNEYVKAKGIAQKSTKTIFGFADQLIAKVPGCKETIEYVGESLILFEVRLHAICQAGTGDKLQIISLHKN